MPPAPTVIIPSLAGGERLRGLLASLAAQTADHQVIVVDNASANGAVASVAAEFPAVEVMRLDRNEGFSRAVNLGAGRADGDALVLLNDDCRCDPGFVAAITAALDPGGGVVMAAGVMRDRDDGSLIDTAGMELDRTLLVFDYLHGRPVSVLAGGVEDPIGPCAATAAFDRAAYEAVGGFDERLFAYWEDVDLVLRLRREGGTCALAPAALGVHEHSATLGPGSAAKNYLTGYGRGYTLRKWGVLTPGRAPAILARDLPICLGQAMIDRNVAGIRGRIQGLRDAPVPLPYPAGDLSASRADGAVATLGRRLRRRRMLRRRSTSIANTALAAGAERPLIVMHDAGFNGPGRSLEALLGDDGDQTWLRPRAGLDRVPARAGRDEVVAGYAALTVPGDALGGLIEARLQAAAVRRIGAVIDAVEPDVVIVASATVPAALVAARRRGVPAVLMANELLTGPGRDGARAAAGSAVIRAAGGLAGAVVACSDTVAREYRARGVEATVIAPPIEPGTGPRPSASVARRSFGLPARATCVVAAGAISRGRGQDVLIRAVAELCPERPDLRCLIAGAPFARPEDVAFEAELRELIADLGLEDRCILTGALDDLGTLFAAARVVVNPCLVPESFGRVAFEAGLAGRPCVSSAVGAVSELLSDGESALLVEPGDATALARAVGRVLDDPALARRLAAGAREVATRDLDPEPLRARFAAVIAGLGAEDGTR